MAAGISTAEAQTAISGMSWAARQVQRRVSVEGLSLKAPERRGRRGSALAVLPAAVTKAKAARVPPIHWLKVSCQGSRASC